MINAFKKIKSFIIAQKQNYKIKKITKKQKSVY
jgi:hypothetical protein